MRRILRLLLGVVTVGLVNPMARGDEPVDYLRDIKPLLARQCVGCHSAEKPRGKLRLDTAEWALQGGLAGPSVVPGDPDESELIFAVIGEGSTDRMPLNKPPLSEAEIDLLRRWIIDGAKAPDNEEPSVADDKPWAFLPPIDHLPPPVDYPGWVGNPIDAFILAPLAKEGIAPSPEADRVTLLRRLSLDLIGLPPTPEQVDAFLADQSPDAYDRQVDRLLASPAHGERWGRWWLDMARYGDSNGYSIDAPREIWKYRDWVLDALNADMPFDRFTVEQLAGDLLPEATIAQRIATGFHRNTQINQEGGVDPEQFRIEAVHDRVGTTGTVWLGLSVACAQCHDHKYDPISQKEYYQLFAFFNNCDEPTLPVGTPEDLVARRAAQERVAEYVESLTGDERLLAKQKAWETSLDMEGRQKQSEEVRKAFDSPFDERLREQNRVVLAAYLDQSSDDEAALHKKELSRLRSREPKIPTTLVLAERRDRRETRLFEGGDFTRPGAVVEPATLADLPPLSARGETPDRLDLANWLVDPGNPLTARVLVNRLWQTYFGRGLVETENDFGTQSSPPTHPELLDWLARRMIDDGWSLKAMHRRIVTSATYRQASTHRPDLNEIDPDNRRLARQSRLRLDAELVRDASLVASGLLTAEVGGPSVFPPQPDGVMSLGQMRREWRASTGADRFRRGLYTYLWRATPHPLLTGFDAPDGLRTCTRRPRSNTPLQALMLLNDKSSAEFATALAEQSRTDSEDDRERLRRAFRLALAREPEDSELARLLELLEAERRSGPPATERPWVAIARVLLNLDEFLTRE
jgi:mono/diheme cytochrome c family protein